MSDVIEKLVAIARNKNEIILNQEVIDAFMHSRSNTDLSGIDYSDRHIDPMEEIEDAITDKKDMSIELFRIMLYFIDSYGFDDAILSLYKQQRRYQTVKTTYPKGEK